MEACQIMKTKSESLKHNKTNIRTQMIIRFTSIVYVCAYETGLQTSCQIILTMDSFSNNDSEWAAL